MWKGIDTKQGVDACWCVLTAGLVTVASSCWLIWDWQLLLLSVDQSSGGGVPWWRASCMYSVLFRYSSSSSRPLYATVWVYTLACGVMCQYFVLQ